MFNINKYLWYKLHLSMAREVKHIVSTATWPQHSHLLTDQPRSIRSHFWVRDKASEGEWGERRRRSQPQDALWPLTNLDSHPTLITHHPQGNTGAHTNHRRGLSHWILSAVLCDLPDYVLTTQADKWTWTWGSTKDSGNTKQPLV